MAFKIDSLADLVGRARSAFRAYIPGSDAWLWPNNLYVTAKVFGGIVYEVFGFADYIAKQKFSGTADGDNLELHAQEVGLSRREATPASGIVDVVVLSAFSVAAGAVLRRTDGFEYVAQASASSIGSGTLNVSVVALVDGASGNAEPGTSLEFVSGFTDTAGTAAAVASVAAAGIRGGADVEPDGEQWTTDLGTLRGRVLFRKRNPPHGGSPADYVQWASDVSGVTRVFVERRYAGPGTVRVFILMDDLYPDASGIPQAGDIARVQAYLDTVAPAGASVLVAAPTAIPVSITVAGLSPNTADAREAVLAELRDVFMRKSRVAGSDTPVASLPFLASPYSFARSWIWQAVANTAGVDSDAITVPAADVALSASQIPTLGAVTFT